ncbi:hypothetical protein MANES_09G071119v8 [Manihot esculenta]|uniref:Uncharacterized protein n=1 Tax=Manihot esculenta TaxID=3983 RepID=A0ACB7H3Q9_MANES|nr:hypothetical protein MANES_09G071119v8 [Manihot esculenta]
MATEKRNSQEFLPPSLNSTSIRPPLFYGTTSFSCKVVHKLHKPIAQRAWITRNYKGLQERIVLVAMDLEKKPVWYKEVYSEENVKALEHDNKVIVESLNVINYIDKNFEGPSLFPNELLSYSETFNAIMYNSFKGEIVREANPAFDVLEAAFSKFDDGPFSLATSVDMAYIPFVERANIFLSQVWKYEITKGRPKLASWIKVSRRYVEVKRPYFS